jgi:hypothetical protein
VRFRTGAWSRRGYHLRIGGHESPAHRLDLGKPNGAGDEPTRRKAMNTKLVVAVATLVVAFAGPALAQTAQQQQPRQQHSVNPSYDVYKNGQYLGSDPDPNIRALMQRGNGPAGQW